MTSDRTTRDEDETATDRKVVLVVDDEPDILELLDLYMEEELPFVTVLGASTGEKALALLRDHRVDLIISDFRMPKMDGVELLSKAREAHPEVPRVLYTAYDDPALERRAREEAGVHAIYSKDLPATELTANIRGLLRDHPVQAARRA